MSGNGYWEYNPKVVLKQAIFFFMHSMVPTLNLDIIANNRNAIVDVTLERFGMTKGKYFPALVNDAEDCFDDIMMELRSHKPSLALKARF